MAVSNTTLNTINIFSSPTVFNANINNVNANDLNFIRQTANELAIEGNGIVAQSLGSAGYIKFSNGLIWQWGSFANGTNYFPIAFSQVFSITAGGEADWADRDIILLKNPTATYFKAEVETTTTMRKFMALGI